MNIIRRNYLHILLCLSGLIFLAGCSAYHNATAYFNTYYNAQKVFNDAVREVEKTPQKDRDTNYFRPYVIQKSVATKFEKVIEKCSKVIQLYTESSYLDNSLLMIGQSYVYRGETESAIRKFREFLENFPTSPLRYEVKLWLAIALYQSGKQDETLLTLKELIPEVTEAGEDDMAVLGMLLEAQIMFDREDYEDAITIYEKGMNISAKDDLLARLHYSRAQCYEKLNRPKEAADAYAKVPDYVKVFSREFQARLQSGRMLVLAGDHEAAFKTFSDIGSENLKPDERGLVELERAKTYMVTGDTIKAFEIFETIDSTYKRTDASAKAYYERGVMYDNVYSDYPRAKFYYEKAKSEFPSSVIAPLAQKKLNTFIQYFKIHDNLRIYDSLLIVALNPDSVLELSDSTSAPDSLSGDDLDVDSLKNIAAENDSLISPADKTENIVKPDSLPVVSLQRADTLSLSDTLNMAKGKVSSHTMPIPGEVKIAKSDTTKKADNVAAKPVIQSLSPDSIRSILAKNKYELASLFFLQVNHYDSAAVWFRNLIDGHPNSGYIPRSLYALSEIERSRGDSAAVDSLYTLILARYDTTEYAKMVKISRGLEIDSTKLDSALVCYSLAESRLLAGDTTGALEGYSGIADKYHSSSVAPKSLYAVGWILENYYSLNDSAYFWYKRLLKEYPASVYAIEVKGKVAVKENPEKLSEFIKINQINAIPISTKPGKPGRAGVTRQEEENNGDQNPNSRLNRRDAQQDEDEEEVDPDEEAPSKDEEQDDEPGYNIGGL